MYNLNELWDKCLEILKLETTSVAYKNYIECIKPYSFNNNRLALIIENETQYSIVKIKYQPIIESAITKVTGEEITVIISRSETVEGPKEDNNISEKSGINNKYNFDNFVVGDNNRLAFTAALNAAELPGKLHNPVFIYGPPGLGKTHLMHAIGNHILQEGPNAKVVYVTSESFTNEFITYIQQKKNMQEFRNKYRYCSLFLIDDIQFLAKKKETQEEFFHTFNTLVENDAQIVISSDRPPRDIPDIDERLISRFGMGLMADIAEPELETRIAILRRKIEEDDLNIPSDVVNYIADTITSNIRELEGSLKRIVAYSKIKKQDITVALTKEAFKGIYIDYKPTIVTPNHIKDLVCDYMNVSMEDLIGTNRSRNIVFPRQIAQYLIRTKTNLSYPMIAEQFTVKDHTTIIHSCEKIEKELKTDERTRTIIKDISHMLAP